MRFINDVTTNIRSKTNSLSSKSLDLTKFMPPVPYGAQHLYRRYFILYLYMRKDITPENEGPCF
jgi:hypothetical protein